MERSETRYAWNGDVALAYQLVGAGPLDLVYLEGYASHVDLNWESPRFAAFLEGLAEHARLIVSDRRGYGCSDRFAPPEVPEIDVTTDDLLAVLDAADSKRAVVFATSFTGYLGAHFAASHPDRVMGLILESPLVATHRTPDIPWGLTDDWYEQLASAIKADWGTPQWRRSPGIARQDPVEQDWFSRWQRASIAPGAFLAETHRRFDFSGVLSSIHVPTLVMADADGDGFATPENARYVARQIAGAELVELHRNNAVLPWYDGAETIVSEIGRFVRGIREHQATFDRLLATVMFTDIVDSTAQAAALGDRAWRQVRERHDGLVRNNLSHFRGREIKTLGDGFLATFDGPARAVRCAQATVRGAEALGIQIRAGLHTGEIELDGDDITGIAVAIGARIGALARPSEVLVSQTIKDLTTGSGIAFDDRGEHELKGVPDTWRLYAATA